MLSGLFALIASKTLELQPNQINSLNIREEEEGVREEDQGFRGERIWRKP